MQHEFTVAVQDVLYVRLLDYVVVDTLYRYHELLTFPYHQGLPFHYGSVYRHVRMVLQLYQPGVGGTYGAALGERHL